LRKDLISSLCLGKGKNSRKKVGQRRQPNRLVGKKPEKERNAFEVLKRGWGKKAHYYPRGTSRSTPLSRTTKGWSYARQSGSPSREEKGFPCELGHQRGHEQDPEPNRGGKKTVQFISFGGECCRKGFPKGHSEYANPNESQLSLKMVTRRRITPVLQKQETHGKKLGGRFLCHEKGKDHRGRK